MRLKKLGVIGLMIAMVGLLVVLPIAPANATRNLLCQAAGETAITPVNAGASYDWTVSGSGECVGGIQGILTVVLSGTGSSATLGLCSGHLVVQGLDIVVTLALTNHKTGVTTTIVEHWDAPLTTYPTATPFLVESTPGNTVGVGVLSDHIFALLDQSRCPPGGGAPSTLFAWVQQTKSL
jgi:hypothetical protein